MLRGKENKMKSCVKFVCSKVKQSAAAIQPAPYSQCRLRNCLPGRKGIFLRNGKNSIHSVYPQKSIRTPLPLYLKHVLSQRTLSSAYAQFAAPVRLLKVRCTKCLCAHESCKMAARGAGTLIPFLPSVAVPS